MGKELWEEQLKEVRNAAILSGKNVFFCATLLLFSKKKRIFLPRLLHAELCRQTGRLFFYDGRKQQKCIDKMGVVTMYVN